MVDVYEPGEKARLVGMAIAGADLIFEVDGSGTITFALGASVHLTGVSDGALVGCSWTALLADDDAAMMAATAALIAPGERRGPFRVRLVPVPGARLARYASLSVFRLPQAATGLSCALSLGATGSGDVNTQSGGLLGQDQLCGLASKLARERQSGGAPVTMELVELSGYRESLAALPSDDARLRRKMVTGLLVETAVSGAVSELAEGRFAMLRDGSASAASVAEQLKAMTGITPKLVNLKIEDLTEAQGLKALRCALDVYIAEGAQASRRGFDATVDHMVKEALRFKDMVARGAFLLAFQPVVKIGGGGVSHFEALARFDVKVSPADTIKLAEELDIIVDFDLAVVRNVCSHLRSHPNVSIAVNISGASLLTEGLVPTLLAALSEDPLLYKRLIIELTETAALGCLQDGAAVLKRLRSLGFKVCIDDFGAGAASLEYLSMLEVDFVKFDGCFLKQLKRGSRNYIILGHLVRMCNALGARTIAEMVETAAVSALLAELGIEHGQGWFYGMPTRSPNWGDPDPGEFTDGLADQRRAVAA